MTRNDLLLWAAGWVGGLLAVALILQLLLILGILGWILFGKRK